MTERTSFPADQPGQVPREEIDRIVNGTHHDPHSVLGTHPVGGTTTVIRALRPLASTVTAVLPDGRRFPLKHVYQGLVAATLPVSQVPDYRIADDTEIHYTPAIRQITSSWSAGKVTRLSSGSGIGMSESSTSNASS